MIKVYVLDCDTEEIESKSFSQLTELDFTTFGKCYSLEDFEYGINNPDLCNFNLSNQWFKFIEDKKNSVANFLRKEIGTGIVIKFIESSNLQQGIGHLYLNEKDMPKI